LELARSSTRMISRMLGFVQKSSRKEQVSNSKARGRLARKERGIGMRFISNLQVISACPYLQSRSFLILENSRKM
jgi:hypothetical protein